MTDFNINFYNFNLVYLFLFVGLFIVLYFTVLKNYKDKSKFLLICRSALLLLLFFLFIKPEIKWKSKQKLKPRFLFFLDNSKSMTKQEGFDRSKLLEGLRQYHQKLNNKNITSQYYAFGDSIKKIKFLKELKYNEKNTNLSQVVKFARDVSHKNNITGAVLISDGSVTKGQNPQTIEKRLPFEFFTIGIGDTAETLDASILKFDVNRTINQGDSVKIAVEIVPLTNKPEMEVTLNKDGQRIGRKFVPGTQTFQRKKLTFNFVPRQIGEHKLKLSLNVPEDKNQINNSRVKTISVLDSKKSYVIIGDEFNFDGKIFEHILDKKKRVEAYQIVNYNNEWITSGKEENILQKKWDLVILNGFPGRKSKLKPDQFDRIENKIVQEEIPLLVRIDGNTDINQLKQLLKKSIIGSVKYSNQEKSLYIKRMRNAQKEDFENYILSSTPALNWSELPPIQYPFKKIRLNSDLINLLTSADSRNNSVLSISKKISQSRSYAVMVGSGFWKWHSMTKNTDLNSNYKNMLMSLTRVLTDSMISTIDIYPNKNIYRQGEYITLKGNITNLNNEKVENALVNASIYKGDTRVKEFYISRGNENYQTEFTLNQEGKYKIELNRINSKDTIDKVSREIRIVKQPIEFKEIRLNQQNLQKISSLSGGQQIDLSELGNIDINVSQEYQEVENEIKLWRWKYIFYFMIILFSLEWGYRKLKGFL